MLYAAMRESIGQSSISGAELANHVAASLAHVWSISELSLPVRRQQFGPETMFDPEGTLSIGAGDGWNCVSSQSFRSPMFFNISAGIVAHAIPLVTMHAGIRCEVANEEQERSMIRIRSRHFGLAVIALGRTEGSQLLVEHAMILRDKQSLEIPLELEVIPTERQFQEAISSLSPTQKSFATMFRRMQQSQSAFAILVVQVKPQLESEWRKKK